MEVGEVEFEGQVEDEVEASEETNITLYNFLLE